MTPCPAAHQALLLCDFQARTLEWVAIFFSWNLPWSGIQPFLHWQGDSLPLSYQGSLSVLCNHIFTRTCFHLTSNYNTEIVFILFSESLQIYFLFWNKSLLDNNKFHVIWSLFSPLYLFTLPEFNYLLLKLHSRVFAKWISVFITFSHLNENIVGYKITG